MQDEADYKVVQKSSQTVTTGYDGQVSSQHWAGWCDAYRQVWPDPTRLLDVTSVAGCLHLVAAMDRQQVSCQPFSQLCHKERFQYPGTSHLR